MSFEAKAILMNELEQSLSTQLTAADMSKALTVIADRLAVYEIERNVIADTGADDLLDTYISAMQVQGRSPKTVKRYRYAITRMMRYVNIPTRQITVYHLRQYLAAEKQRGISDSTLEGLRQIFSAYFNWLQRECLIQRNPTANLGAIKQIKKIKDIYSDIDIEKLKYKARTLRDRAIICFLLSTGCRISEMVQLNRNDVDLNSLECTVLGKGNKERTVYIDGVTGMFIRQYLQTRKDANPCLFMGKRLERLTPDGVRCMLHTLERQTDVVNVHPHKFRRTLATTLIHHGMPIQEVAAILGHEKLDTTMQYVVLYKSAVANSYRKYG